MFNLEQLKSRRPNTVTVDVPQWDASVTLRKLALSVKLRIVELGESFERESDGRFKSPADALIFAIELLASSILDDEGRLGFDSDEGRDFLGAEDFAVLQSLLDAAMELNGLTAAATQAETVAAEKN